MRDRKVVWLKDAAPRRLVPLSLEPAALCKQDWGSEPNGPTGYELIAAHDTPASVNRLTLDQMRDVLSPIDGASPHMNHFCYNSLTIPI